MTGPEIAALRRLYASPDDTLATSLAAALPDLGDCVSAQLAELARNPTRDGCDRVAANLGGVQQHVRKLKAAMEVGHA